MARVLALLALAISLVGLVLAWRAGRRADAAAEVAEIAGASAREAKDRAKAAERDGTTAVEHALLLEARLELGSSGPDSVFDLQFTDVKARIEKAWDLIDIVRQGNPHSAAGLVHAALVAAAVDDWDTARTVAETVAREDLSFEMRGAVDRILAHDRAVVRSVDAGVPGPTE